MQIGSSNDSPRRPKANAPAKTGIGKTTKRGKKTDEASETLHLKAKHLVVTSTDPQLIDVKTLIATAAYYRAAQRGFEPGHELDDWLQAEQQVRAYTL